MIAATPLRESQRHEALRTRLTDARSITDSLWDLLRPGMLLERPIPDRHRLIFYLGHLEAFDWNMICSKALDEPSFHPSFDRLFEFGIDPEPGALPDEDPGEWPAESEIRAYNFRVRNKIDERLGYAPADMIEAALEHRLMHAETLAYLLHNLPYTAKVPQPPSRHTAGHPLLTNSLIEVPAGPAVLGKAEDENFGWDNEYKRHIVEVSAFRTSRYKVTNGEYLEFVNDGAPAPHFWVQQRGEWFYRGMFQLQPLPLNHPVYVTQRQAAAYAAWAGEKLLTEPQYHRLASQLEGTPVNYDFVHWDPVPVNLPGTSPLIGNGWEWTRTVFAPFTGFKPVDYYPGYSANFFDGHHYVLKGASPRTAACFLRPSFRNWFRADYPYAYATFRVAEEAV